MNEKEVMNAQTDKLKMNNQFYFIKFKLFWDDRHVGFAHWSAEGKGMNYTGVPEGGWSGVYIPHNRMEIIDIKYIDDEYLEQKEQRKILGESMVRMMELGRFHRELIN